MSITIKDIAKKTGISTSTISRVLSQRGYVSEETRRQVEEAVKETGYVYKPNIIKRGSIDMVMVIMGDAGKPVYAENIKGLASVFDVLNINFVNTYGLNYDPNMQENYMMRAIRSHFMGMILMCPIETPTFMKLVNNCSIPCVGINRPLHTVQMDLVCLDNKAAGAMAVDYLVQHGHTRIGYLGVVDSTPSDYRMCGYIEGLKRNGLEYSESDMLIVKDDFNAAVYAGNLFATAKRDITAIYTSNELIAGGLIDGIRQCGLRVPEDISVISTDNTNSSIMITPKLTTVGASHFDMGAEAAKLFIQRLNNPMDEKRKIYFKPKIIERDSVSFVNK